MWAKTVGILGLGLGALTGGIMIASVHLVAAMGVLVLSAVLLGAGFLLFEKEESGAMGYRAYRLYTFITVSLGIPAVCVAAFATGRILFLAGLEPTFDLSLELALSFTIAAATVIAYEVSGMVQSMLPRYSNSPPV